MSRVDKAVIQEFLEKNPLDVMVESRVKLGRPNAKGVRAGPCPCEPSKGKTPFWVNPDTHRWGCLKGGCQGDTFDWLQKFCGMDFKAALVHLGGGEAETDPDVLAAQEAERAKAREERERQRAGLEEKERKRAFEIWERGVPAAGTLVEAYLGHRGLTLPDTPSLRFTGDETYWATDGEKPEPVHVGPCMLAAIQAPDGKFLGVHRTWLDPRLGTAAMPADASGKADIVLADGTPAENKKKMRGLKKTGAIRLTRPPAGDGKAVLIIGEGIETTLSALAALQRHGKAAAYQAWAAGDLGNIGGGALGFSTAHPTKAGRTVPSTEPDLKDPGLMPAAWASMVMLLGDGDSDPHVTRAQLERGKARYEAAGFPTLIRFAPKGRDFNDMVRPAAEPVLEEVE